MQTALNKSEYLQYLSCPNEFWLARKNPGLFVAAETLEYEHLRAQGYAVQRLVRRMELFRDNPNAEFEAVFATDDLYARSDIIVRVPETGEIDIWEVKSSVKPEHIDDVAFQKRAAEAAGEKVRRCYVVTANCDYVRISEIDPDECFTINDVTDLVAEKEAETLQRIQDAFAYLSAEPSPRLADHCGEKLNCRYIQHHFPELPEYSVFDVSRLHKTKLRDLLERDIVDIMHIPADFKLSEKQRRQVDAAQSGEIIIDAAGITSILSGLEFPLHFLDYETFSYAIPQFEGVRPFQQMAFQYSLYTMDDACAEIRNSRFLSDGGGHPCRDMAAHLFDAMAAGIGSVVTWNAGFEKKCNDDMAAMYPEFAGFFEEVNARTFDLMEIFSKHHYIHPAFKGRSSLKKVLPVVEPALGYDFMEIGDGMTASIQWFRMATKHYDEARCREIFDHLHIYCNQDTYGMVAIYKALRAHCSNV